MAWYECQLCGEFEMIRAQDVKPDKTVSCGCVGRKQNRKKIEKPATPDKKRSFRRSVISLITYVKCAALRLMARTALTKESAFITTALVTLTSLLY
jgi:hypothetical protein